MSFRLFRQSSIPGGATWDGVYIMQLAMFSLSPTVSSFSFAICLVIAPASCGTANVRSSKKLKHPDTGLSITAARCAWRRRL